MAKTERPRRKTAHAKSDSGDNVKSGPRLGRISAVVGWATSHLTQLVLAALSLVALIGTYLVDRPLWATPDFGFPNGAEVQVFTPDNYDPTAVMSICSFGESAEVAVTLTPSSNYIEVRLPTGASSVQLNTSFAKAFLAGCSPYDVPSEYESQPDPSPPTDVRLVPEPPGVHYSNLVPAPLGASNPFVAPHASTRWWALTPSERRSRVSIAFRWDGAVHTATFADRYMWVQVGEPPFRQSVEGQGAGTVMKPIVRVLWVLAPTDQVTEAPINSSVSNLRGFPLVVAPVTSSADMLLTWRDQSAADSRDALIFGSGALYGIFGGLLAALMLSVAVGVDARLDQVRYPRGR